jgi:predicted kinase
MKIKITPTVYVAVGLPASGKSFWWETAISKKLLPVKSCRRLNADIIRNDITGDLNDHSQDDLVKKILFSNLQNFLLHKIPIIYVDDLNIERSVRHKIIKLCQKYNYKTTALVFETDSKQIQSRLNKSSKKIPLELLERYIKILQENPTDYNEGWDDIIVIK